MIKRLNDFTPFQWELAIVASRFQLGLLSNNEIIAFTHKLMDKGYYDDVMLDIIDNNPFNEVKDNFKKLIENLHLPKLNHSDSRYFNVFYLIYPFTIRPLHINYFDKDSLFYYEFFLSNMYGYLNANSEILLDNDKKALYFVDFDKIIGLIYEIDYTLDYFFQDINTSSEYADNAVFEFLTECENWLKQNQAKVLNIMDKIYA